jgi:hypothetical protein
MQAIKVNTTVEKEGELHLTNLPLHSNQRVEIIVLVPEETTSVTPTSSPQVAEEEWQRLVQLIRQSEPHFSSLDEAMNLSRGRP